MIKNILFDLDSTLLQMNQDLFLKLYFKSVAKKMASLGYNVEEFMDAFNKSAYAILKNDGSKTNQECFFMAIKKTYPEADLEPIFMEYYKNEFTKLEEIVSKSDIPNLLVKELKKQGYNIFLATNPLFPRVCTLERMRWAGLDPNDFLDITTYENSHFSKPSLAYFNEVLKKNNLKEEECIMVGNDVDDDFSNLPSKIKKVLITDYLINKQNKSISEFTKFTLEEFYNYILNNKL